jgi:hypothetical protein
MGDSGKKCFVYCVCVAANQRHFNNGTTPPASIQSYCESRAGHSLTSVSAYSVMASDVDASLVVGGSFVADRLFFADYQDPTRRFEIKSFAREVSSFILKLSGDGKVEWLVGPTVFDMQYVTAVGIDRDNNGEWMERGELGCVLCRVTCWHVCARVCVVYAGGYFQGAVRFDGTAASLPNALGVQVRRRRSPARLLLSRHATGLVG